VPLIVATFEAQAPVTPAGNPLNVAPVVVVVAYVMLVIAVLMHRVCESVPAADVSVTVLLGVTEIVPVVVVAPHPPVNVTV
jgi:hypothetical protein